MRWPWHQNGTTTDEQPAEPPGPPAERDADGWRVKVRDLKTELVWIGQELQQLLDSASDALLTERGALVSDIQSRRAELLSAKETVEDAIVKAERHLKEAQQREDREALDSEESEYYTAGAAYYESRARFKDAEEHMIKVRAAESLVVAPLQISTRYGRLLEAGRAPEPVEQPEVRRLDAAGYRLAAERFRQRAGRVAADVAEQAAIVAEAEPPAAAPALNHSKLSAIDAEIRAARSTLARALEDNPADAPTWQAKVDEAEAKRAEVARELEEVPA